MKPAPPNVALRFLRWFCREDYLEEVEGDLVEVYESHYQKSPAKAKRKFIWTVLKYFRPEFIKAFNIGQNSTTMIQHNTKIAYRNSLKYKNTFFINLLGLATGLACALLIFLWVQDERSIDKFHENDDRLFQIMQTFDLGHTKETVDWNPMPLSDALKNQMPGVEYVTAAYPPSNYAYPGKIKLEDRKVKVRAKYVEKDFFNAFTYRLLAGDKSTLLSDKYACAVSEDLATELYGSVDEALGKAFSYELGKYSGEFTISGVFENMPSNASIQFNLAFNYDLYTSFNPDIMRWDYNSPCVYVTLTEGTDTDAFENKITGLLKKNFPETEGNLFLRQYSSQYLYGNVEDGKQTGGRISYVILFSMIAVFLLVIACINFMNLATARASRRTKEIGVKKSIGAKRSDLIIQYLFEAVITSFLSMSLALLIVYLIMPQFNLITGKQLALVLSAEMILSLIGIAFFTGLLAGSYPALYLSGLSPIKIFKGGPIKSVSAFIIRKGLVIFQFTISLMLILMVFTVARQVEFIKTKNLGFDRDNVIFFNESIPNYTTFKNHLETLTGVVSVSAIRGDLTSGDRNNTTSLEWEGKQEGDIVDFDDVLVDPDFFSAVNIQILEGRGFSDDMISEENSLIFNQTAIEQMGLEEPIGKIIDMWGKNWTIVGVVKDFHLESLYKEVRPAFFRAGTNPGNAVVKIENGKTIEAVQAIEAYYKEQNDGLAPDYQFLDDTYDRLYAAEQRVSTLSKYFAGVAIIISCLGLFGLAAFTAEIRLKEIGIRKILGSANSQIVVLLSKDYTKMVLVANLIGLPLGYYLIHQWLSSFAFKIDLSIWFFVAAAVLTVFIALLTVGFQTLKAARVHVLETLRE